MSQTTLASGTQAPDVSPETPRVKIAGLIASAVVTVALLIIPMTLTWPQQVVAAVGIGVVILWFTEALPLAMSALLAVALLVLLGAGEADALIAPMGSTTLLTFIGAFMIAQAMLVHGAGRRFALRMLSAHWVAQSPWRLIAAFGGAAALLSTIISNTATVAMLLPTCTGMIAVLADILKEQEGDHSHRHIVQMGAGLLLALTYGSSIGGMITPIGSPPNLIGIELVEDTTGQQIGFLDWSMITTPVAILLFGAMLVVVPILNPYRKVATRDLRRVLEDESAELGPITSAEKRTIAVLALTALAWILPSIVRLIAGEDAPATEWFTTRFDEGVVAIVGASLLFILPAGGRKAASILRWKDGREIDWGTIMLFAGGMVLGGALQSTGLAEVIGDQVGDWVGDSAGWVVLLVAVVMALTLSELASNTASTLVMVPITIPIAMASGADPIAVGLAATLAATLGFVLPVSTTQNAIVFGSGKLPLRNMVRTGLVFDVVSLAIIAAVVPVTAGFVLG